jgi:DNA-binding response OmpR family regulator
MNPLLVLDDVMKQEEMDTPSKKVLVVDDEAAILFAFVKVLTTPGLDIYTAQTLARGLELIRKEVFCAVIADLRLSELGGNEGYEIIRAASEKCKECRIIVMTAHGDENTRKQIFSLGAHFYMQKPVSPHKVKEILSSMGIA